MHNCYIEKILADAKHEGMVELRKVLDKALQHLKESEHEEYEHLELCLYKAAYGKVLTEDMAKHIIYLHLKRTKNIVCLKRICWHRTINM